MPLLKLKLRRLVLTFFTCLRKRTPLQNRVHTGNEYLLILIFADEIFKRERSRADFIFYTKLDDHHFEEQFRRNSGNGGNN